jgi:phosphoglycolate phosphatase-like HAD superfamily hydrolase
MALADVRRRMNGKVDVDRMWVIGDTPGDVRCGRAIGAKVIAVATGESSLDELAACRPDHVAADFSDATGLWSLWK